MMQQEAYIRKALEIAENEDGRWIANQAHFNASDNEFLMPLVHAAIITATAIYFQRGMIEEKFIQCAIDAKTVGSSRALIERLLQIIRPQIQR